MKKLLFILAFSLLLVACKDQTGSIQEAEEQFVKEVQYMSEKEALSKEIGYYKSPEITTKRKVRNLTGKDAIHECNLLLQENSENLEDLRDGRRSVVRTWNCGAEKSYAVDHPDDIVGAEYYFEGTFTHYNNGYGQCKAKVLLINGTWFVIQKY